MSQGSGKDTSIAALGRTLYAITDSTVPSYIYRTYMKTGINEAQPLRYGYMFTLKYVQDKNIQNTFLMYNTQSQQFSTISNPPLSENAQSMEVSPDRYVVMYFAPERGIFYEDVILSMPIGMSCVKFTLYSSSGLLLCNGNDYAVVSPWSGSVRKSFADTSPGCCSNASACSSGGTMTKDLESLVGNDTSIVGGFCMTTIRKKVTAIASSNTVLKLVNGKLEGTLNMKNIVYSGGASFWIRLTALTSSTPILTLGTAAWGIVLTAIPMQTNQYGLSINTVGGSVQYISQRLSLNQWTHISVLYNVWRQVASNPAVFNFVINGRECDTVQISNENFKWQSSNANIPFRVGPLTGETSNWIFWKKDTPPVNVLKQMFQYNDSTFYTAVKYGIYYFPLINNLDSFNIGESVNTTLTKTGGSFITSSASRNFYNLNPLQQQPHTIMGKLLNQKGWQQTLMRKKGTGFISAPCSEIGQPCIVSDKTAVPSPVCQVCSSENIPRIFELCPSSTSAEPTGKFCQSGNKVPLSSCNSENGNINVSYIGGNISISSSSPSRIEYEFTLTGNTFYNAWIKFSGAVASNNIFCYLYNVSTKTITEGFSVAWDVARVQPPPTNMNKQSYNGISGISTTYNNKQYWVQLGTSNAGFFKCKQDGVYRLVIAALLYKGTFEGGLSGSASVSAYKSLCSNVSATDNATTLTTPLTRAGLPFIYDIVFAARDDATKYVNIDPVKKLYLESAQYSTQVNSQLSVSKIYPYQYASSIDSKGIIQGERQKRAAGIMYPGGKETVSKKGSSVTYTQESPPVAQQMSVLPRGQLPAGGVSSSISSSSSCVDSCLKSSSCTGAAIYSTYNSTSDSTSTNQLKCVKYSNSIGTTPCTHPCVTPVVLSKTVDTSMVTNSQVPTQNCAQIATSRSATSGSSKIVWKGGSYPGDVDLLTTPSTVYSGLPSSLYEDNGTSLGIYNMSSKEAASKCDSLANCSFFKCYDSGNWTPYKGVLFKRQLEFSFQQ